MSLYKKITPILDDLFHIFVDAVLVKVEGETKTLKRRFTKWMIMWTYYAFALSLVLIGLIFLGWALFTMLALSVSAHAAALIVGGIIFVLGTVMMFMVVVNLMR
ncbi:MAG: hypothetical protein A2Y10_05285 [Planctomycetes bacterium GWF2_41_51]|nr:MAG: hypothetical protein A2Y10_05285 [Planctomycetes bacterium GWF2_41_51]